MLYIKFSLKNYMKNITKGMGLGFIFIFLLICCVCTCCFWLLFASASGGNFDPNNISYNYKFSEGNKDSQNKILFIDVKGIILNEGGGSSWDRIFSSSDITYGYDIQKQLERARFDSSIKGVVLLVDSPGGTITGSEAIYDGVLDFRNQSGKPVIAWGSGAMASGAYWAALAADEIHMDSGSIVGSIGVISGEFKYYNNVSSEGSFLGSVTAEDIDTTYITAGKGKDLGNPYRQITPEEQQLMQSLADNSYDDFVQRVVESRNISESEVRDNIGAYIYDEELGLENNLIDSISNRNEMLDRIAEIVEIDRANLQFVREEIPLSGFWGALFSAKNSFISDSVKMDSKFNQICTYNFKPIAFHGNLASVCN